ncbi:MAG: hypothetical protein U9R75_09140 [Candidatus Thermoplasmatota archaeon]|nr:hypothetical protein [Candidatus Thermoplasmatota archaeon]
MEDIAFGLCSVSVLLILLGVMVALIIRSALKMRVAHIMKNTETSSIVDVRPGFVELKGRIEPILGRVLRTPITRMEAVLYDSKLQRYESHGKSGRWRTIWKRSERLPFLVNDGSAKMKIHPSNARLELDLKNKESMGGFNGDPSPQFREFLRSQGISEKGFFGMLNQSLRFEASYLEPYRDVYILGSAVDAGLETELERDPMIMPFTMSKGITEKTFLISDRTEEKLYTRIMVFNVLIIVICSMIALVPILTILAIMANFIF